MLLEWPVLLLVSTVESADLALMGSLFKLLQKEFEIGPVGLGWLSFVQAAAVKFSVVYWGPEIDRQKNPWLFLRMSLIGIGIFSLLTGMVSSFSGILICRFWTGAFSALVRPLSGYVITQNNSHDSRGKYFGIFRVSQSVGSIIGVYIGAAVASHFGWRNLVKCFGAVALAFGLALPWIERKRLKQKTSEMHYEAVSLEEEESHTLEQVEPEQLSKSGRRRRTFDGESTPTDENSDEMKKLGAEDMERFKVSRVFKTRTFQLIMLHGIFGTFPYSGFSFLVLWFQSAGVKDSSAGIMANSLHAGSIFGHLFAGYVGDYASKQSPNHGRIYIAQLGDFLRIPMTIVVFGLNLSNWSRASFLFSLGLVIPLVGSGAISPMLTELAPPELSGSVSGYHLALESIFSTLAGPVVGILAERAFGYDVKALSQNCKENSINCFSQQNHDAISSALLYNTAIPWCICSIIVTALHSTFPTNRYTPTRPKVRI